VDENKSFEEALQELEKLAMEMEQKDLALADAITKFEKGIQLSRYCRDRLNEADGKISQLTKDNKLEEFLKPEE